MENNTIPISIIVKTKNSEKNLYFNNIYYTKLGKLLTIYLLKYYLIYLFLLFIYFNISNDLFIYFNIILLTIYLF